LGIEEGLELVDEELEVVVNLAPFGIAAGEFNNWSGTVGGQALLDDRKDFGRSGVRARNGDAAAVAEGFEKRGFAGGIDVREGFQGGREWDLE
jgi:hypothetical protein